MPKIVDQEQYRKELLQKAFDLLAQKGYANVTTRQLAKELGISTGAMYHYFPSKKALFEQLVEEVGWQDIAAFQQTVIGVSTLAERIAALGQFLIDHEDYLIKQTAVWTDYCMQAEASEISNNEVFRRVDERYCQGVAETLGLSDRSVTRFIWTLVNGILLEQVSDHDTKVFAKQIHLLVQMLTAYFEKFPM